MDSATSEVQCPICNQEFEYYKIERHVDSCLLNSQKEKPATRSIGKSSNIFFQRKPKRKLSPTPEKLEKKKKIDNKYGESSGDEITKDSNCKLIQNDIQDCKQESLKKHKNNDIISYIIEDIDSPPSFLGNDTKNDAKTISNTVSPMNEFKETLLKWSGKKITKSSSNEKQFSSANGHVVEEKSDAKNTQSENKNLGTAKKVNRQIVKEERDLKDNNSENKIFGTTKRVMFETAARKKLIMKKLVTLGKAPLADQMRPTTFDDYFGQEAVNSNKILKELFNSQRVPSLILWGPPGCGKTSLAHVISQSCKSSSIYRFVTMSATMSGVNDVKETVKVAKNEKKLTHRQTVLFMDEVHRFNKMQQDSFLPHVEDGTIILIGATTENPSFHLNNALLSRCKLVVLSPLTVKSIVKILQKTVACLHGIVGNDGINEKDLGDGRQQHSRFILEGGVLKLIAEYANGDARVALNTLDIVLQAKLLQDDDSKNTDNDNGSPAVLITMEQIKHELKRGYVNYDRNGDDHYDIISALHKSIRGGDANASVYWLARMLEGGETPLYVARRLVRMASEDIGLADPTALTQAVSAYQACTFIGMPECEVILAQVATYLARAPKSIEVYEAYSNAKNTVRTWKGTQPSVPLYLRNAPTRTMKELGYGVGYKYTPKCQDDPSQAYLPKELEETNFFDT